MIISGLVVGDCVNGNEILAIWGKVTTIYILRCGHCGKEFSKTANKMQFYPPKSCGCQRRAAHERDMKLCFRNRPVFIGPKNRSET